MMEETRKRRLSVRTKILIVLALTIITAGGVIAYQLYKIIYAPNVYLIDKTYSYVYIPSGSTYADVIELLKEKEILLNMEHFDRVARKKNYPNHVYSGKYKVEHGMSNNELVNLLRSAKQTPVNVIFNNIRTKEQLAGRIAEQLEADSTALIDLLNNSDYLETFGLNVVNILVMFIPNTYEFYWDTSAESFMKRMQREYKRFWNSDRVEKAKRMALTPVEVSVLASIVQAETSHYDEMPRIAGVYINRLRRNMLLQADPTVVYAWGDFSLRRVLYKHLEIDSPFNTYRVAGLPPGPINLPEARTIESVLNYENHNYLFFCAKDDFSGYHVFAKTHREHINNARRYQQALNRKRIR